MNAKAEEKFTVYGYRWVVLAVFFLITVAIEIQWLSFAPIAREARAAYGFGSNDGIYIDLLALIFLILFIIMCIPASYVIDRYGIRKGIGIGAALTGVFGLMKGIFAASYPMMVVCQVGLGIAQPFILNAVTRVAVNWFPLNERATAVGLGTLAQYVGFIVVSMVTPYLVVKSGETYDLSTMLMTWGVISAVIAVLFLALVREEPPTPPSEHGGEERLLSREGFRHIMSHRDMRIALALFFIGLGMFNAITTCIDQICEIKKLTTEQTGMIMGVMFISGIIGAVVLPTLSDKLRKRKVFMLLGMAIMTPGLAGLTFAESYGLMLASAAVMGFFLLGGAGPIGFQYAAEVSYPAPESLSQGIILLAGQISGILFVVGMNTAGMIQFMIVFIVLAVLNIALAALLRESPMILSGQKE
ncbi:MAG TPA: MFS transporter [Spirochaetota bacterium]|nr:MFS transporter [Spirochaetota bacterium]HQH95724.1 MFS transporter [Spirochaetota bacterium]